MTDVYYKPLEGLSNIFGGEDIAEKTISVLTKCKGVKTGETSAVEGRWTQKHMSKIQARGTRCFEKIPFFVAGHAKFNRSGKLQEKSTVDGDDRWCKHLWDGIAGHTDKILTPILLVALPLHRLNFVAITSARAGLVPPGVGWPWIMIAPIMAAALREERPKAD